jgi:hypothetical protein
MGESASDWHVPAEDTPSLLVVGESGVFSSALPAQGEITVGRSTACDVVVDDPNMSRRHLVLRTAGDGSITVTDLGGTNGTLLGEHRLAPNVAVALPRGAMLTAASTVMVIRTRAEAASATGLVNHAELRAQLLAECNRAGATQQIGDAFALVRVQSARPRDARAIEEVLGWSLRKRDVVAAVTPGTYVALLSGTSATRADAVASRVASVLARRGVDAKLHVAVYPRDGDTPELLDQSAGTETVHRGDVELERGYFAGAPPRALEAEITAVAAAQRDVLLCGEVGVGKEVVARIIHARSAGAGRPFVRVDPQALGETASVLADALVAAEGGTVFLDEIGTLDATAQAKLLETIAQRGWGPHWARIIATTRRDLDGESGQGSLLADFARRFDGARMTIPPLRARVAEIEPLAKELARAACLAAGIREDVQIAAPAMALLKHHSWPRNVRELKDVIERAVLLAGDVITLAHLPCQELAPVVSVRRVS